MLSLSRCECHFMPTNALEIQDTKSNKPGGEKKEEEKRRRRRADRLVSEKSFKSIFLRG
jgi:hypothetical protein